MSMVLVISLILIGSMCLIEAISVCLSLVAQNNVTRQNTLSLFVITLCVNGTFICYALALFVYILASKKVEVPPDMYFA